MLKDIFGRYYFDGNYNCAETMIRAANEYYGLGLHDRDMIMVGGYGGGMQCGNTCGAVLSAVAVLSMKYVENRAHDSKDIRPAAQLLIRKFNEKYGSTLCKDIKPQSFTTEYRCRKTIEAACDILEATITQYEAERE